MRTCQYKHDRLITTYVFSILDKELADKVIQQEKEQQKNGYKPCILAKTHDPRFTDQEKLNMTKLHGNCLYFIHIWYLVFTQQE